jgi:uncharacterized repeat protein (TIGR03843 family)
MDTLDTADALRLLRDGELEIEGRLVSASNATFYCSLRLDGVEAACVYKPVRGERPLWDFPNGTLAQREVATYLLSAASGWNLVPPTVLRDGPLGEGMAQLWIEPSMDVEMIDIVPRAAIKPGWRHVLDAFDSDGDEISLVHAEDESLRRLALLDSVVNNADRKGGHVLVSESRQVFGVDHGLCFHEEDKLRTVLWGWAGEPLPPEHVEVLEKLECDLTGPVGGALRKLIHRDELEALRVRLQRLRLYPVFPERGGDGWPSIPWPVF